MALAEKADVMQNEIVVHERRYLFCLSINNNLYGNRTDGRAWVCGDGNARYSMTAVVAGAILNIILDYAFMYVFSWGIAEVAWATVIGQIVSAVLLMLYFPVFHPCGAGGTQQFAQDLWGSVRVRQ